MPEQVLLERDFGRVLYSVTKFYHGGLLIDLMAIPHLRGLLIVHAIIPSVFVDPFLISVDQYSAILARHPSSPALSAWTTSWISISCLDSSLDPLCVAAPAGSRLGTPEILLSIPATDASLLVSSAALI